MLKKLILEGLGLAGGWWSVRNCWGEVLVGGGGGSGGKNPCYVRFPSFVEKMFFQGLGCWGRRVLVRY